VGALERWGMGRGVFFSTGKGSGKGAVPLLRKFRIFCVTMACFAAFLALFLVIE